jgi:hypothetical protein
MLGHNVAGRFSLRRYAREQTTSIKRTLTRASHRKLLIGLIGIAVLMIGVLVDAQLDASRDLDL